MGDTYVELLVKKSDSKTATLLRVILAVGGAVLFLGGFFTNPLVFILGVIMLGCSFIPTLFLNIEYEYLYLEKELSIDRIRKQTSRKKLAEYQLTSLELMAPVSSARLKQFDSLKVCDYSSHAEESEPYAIIVDGNGEKVKVIIDTNEELLDAIKKTNPRNVYND